MPTPDQFDDFSHLPTIDEGHDEARQRQEALWEKNRRNQPPQTTPPPEAPAPENPIEPTPAVDHAESWRALLELEPDELHYLQPPPEETAPSPAPEPPPPPIRVNKSVIRPQGMRTEPPPISPVPESASIHEAEILEAPEVSRPKDLGVSAKAESNAEAQGHGISERLNEDQAKPSGGAEAVGEVAAKSEKPEGSGKEGSGKDEPEIPKTVWQKHWEKVGGLALALSVGAHLLLIGVGTVWVVSRSSNDSVDFLPGGGSKQGQAASEALEHQIQQKKSPWLKKSAPVTRIAALNKFSEISLPDTPPDLLDMPKAANLMSTGKLTSGMGLGGTGGGLGAGMGLGSRSGMTFQPFSMFGHAIKARHLGVVLDVSTSMMEHLPRVVAEADRTARGSVIILYFGCGLDAPVGGKHLAGDEVYRTSGAEFERFWRMGGGTIEEGKTFKFNPKDPIPMEDVYRLLSRRPQTYFIHSIGLGYTWTALLANEVRSADALYWFSDFEDHVDFKQLQVVQDNLKSRKQKLYIHAYEHGQSFDLVRSQLVEPTGGEVIEEPR